SPRGRDSTRGGCPIQQYMPAASLEGALAFAHEALPGGAHERDRLREQDAHGIAERDCLFVRSPRRLELRECSAGQFHGGVESQRRELLALSLLHRLGLLFGELAQAS